MERGDACSSCLFCKIISSEVESQKVFEDSDLVAFKDINPSAPLHVLIVPKKHIEMLSDTTAEDVTLLGKMMYLAPSIVREQGFCSGAEGGFRLILNNGPDGGQEVPHMHLHVMGGPRPWNSKKSSKISSRKVLSTVTAPNEPSVEVSKGSVFAKVGCGKLAASGAPGKNGVARWANAGATGVVTLLSGHEMEGANAAIAGECGRRGMKWIHLPLIGRRSITMPQESDIYSFSRIRSEVCALLEGEGVGSNVVIHCAAGLHRTGAVCYIVMRICGLDAAEAISTLLGMRLKTGEELLLPITQYGNKCLQEFIESDILPPLLEC